MARPGFVLEVDDRTPPLLVADGPRARLERFPLGTEVVYPAESLARLDDLVGAVDAALADPAGAEPLAAQLRPGMKLTIAFDDVAATPPLRLPDVRGRIIERVLIQAAAAGVDDVELICANGLNRRNTEAELRQVLGERVFRSFYADGKLTNHDAEDTGRLSVLVPGSESAAEVAINSRVAESDLLVMVHLVHGIGQGGLPGDGLAAVTAGLGSVASIRADRSLAAVLGNNAHAAAATDAVAATTPVFQIEAVLDNDNYPPSIDFLGKREWEWSWSAQAKLLGLRRITALTPARYARVLNNRLESGYGVTRVSAGAPDQVAAASRSRVLEQQQVEVNGQADVLVLGVPAATPYSIASVTNPVLAAWHALGFGYQSVTGQPLVRDGGAVIIHHPLAQDFSSLHHPSTIDFFADVLPTTTDAAELSDRFEDKFADDPWYVQLYRTSQAFHGLQPFHLWYQLAPAMQRLGDVVFVGADRRSAGRLGFRAASTLADALEITSATVGRAPRIRYLHTPPNALGTVK
ncbi:MAG TPA: lactate racemase domain-containing protein [Microlunatus sp.]